MMITRRWSVALALSSLLLAGCGDGSSDTAGPPLPIGSASTGPTSAEVPAAVYRGTTPCDGITRPVPTMPAGAKCEMATWRVDLRVDGRYELTAAYGMPAANKRDLRGGGTTVELSGTYGREDKVIRLRTDDPGISLRFLRVGEDVLHLIDPDGRMLVGNGDWSYSLNRDGRSGRRSPVIAASYDEPGAPGGGVFEGRTPCAPELRTFLAKLVTDCKQLNWRLTLRQNAAGEPAGYLSGAVGRSKLAGAWRILRGVPGHPDAVVYELRPAGKAVRLRMLLVGSQNLFLLGPGQQLLVGDEYLSYTLSRNE